MAFIFPNKNIKYKSDTMAAHMPETQHRDKLVKC